ncbi:MAG: tetratricopeptide repeat protein [Bryobacterales bacterium]|nr:tetratricopeptide repeat protein [Bryobacterales bacterium]
MVVPSLALVLLQTAAGSDAVTAAAHSRAENSSLPVSDRGQAYEELIRSNPSNASLYAGYAALLLANRAYTRALTWIEKGLAKTPSDGGLRLRQAIALHALGRHQESLRILEGLPASGESRFYMGLDWRSLGDHKSAQKYLGEAWDLGLRDPYALYSLIEEDHALGDKASGLRHFRWFLTAFPDSPWLHVLYADAYAQKDNDPEARKEYEEALRLKPDLPAVNFRLGFLLYKNGEYLPAAERFRKELDLNPSYSDANLFLGQTLRNLGREQEAIVYLRKAVALDARSEHAYQALVAVLAECGDLEGALEILRMAEKEFPADPAFPAQLARVLTRLNREEEALKEQEKFRALKQLERTRETKR